MSFGFDCFWKLPESSQSRPVATGLCGLAWTLRLWVATFQSDFGLVTLETSCLNGSLSEFLSGLGGTFRESQRILRLPVTLLLQNLGSILQSASLSSDCFRKFVGSSWFRPVASALDDKFTVWLWLFKLYPR